MKGGTFQTFADKSYQALTEEHLIKHLKGEQVVGLYPLLPDNKSWFIAADFDEADWIEECRTFIKICEKMISQPTLSAHVPAKAAMFGYFLKNPMKHSEAEK
ncbi:hypothetical protein ADIARSV_1464 [Arcticibacter svalbardensis MN12-7]|uniref:TOTE conflict system primase domain-containing protein n=1 Tax=Arcticibacter svalbardensis MN12-7 TaxID=1150600 RepID=R9GU12_9SPHI|nr:hypothetical protein ADIARSV_1464 [Arcticibacter svalbardensis MN12-7]